MKIKAAFFLSLLLSTLVYSQYGEISLGLNGSAIIPKTGKTGLGSNVSFIYNISNQLAIHHGIGIFGWGNIPYNSSRIFIYSMAVRYYLTKTTIQPYLSAELNYAIGKFRDTWLYVDESDKLKQFNYENRVNEFISGPGVGIRYPLTELLSLDINYSLMMTVRSNQLYHMRGSVGVLYRL
ncbi:MAG TPA: hypothetical protein VMT35_07760 [Ignavibacteriaceae bacterium]|nr:hypothetical protein [Ignavibacteriaceae bacterium]